MLLIGSAFDWKKVKNNNNEYVLVINVLWCVVWCFLFLENDLTNSNFIEPN